MLVIALMIVLSILATVVALITASPLFRSVTLAFESWSETVKRAEQR